MLSRLKTSTPLQVMLQVRIAEVSRSFVKNIGVNLQSVDATSGFKTGIAQGRGASTQYCAGQPLSTGYTSVIAGTDAAGKPILCPGSIITQLANGSTIGAAGKLLGLTLIGALARGATPGRSRRRCSATAAARCASAPRCRSCPRPAR